MTDIKKPHAEWLEDRGIDLILAQKFGLCTVQRGGRHYLAVPYLEYGKPVNHKYRATSDKSLQAMDDGAPLTLWNHDCLLDQSLNDQPLIITEGEWDALAILSVGKHRVVSVPNGAPARQSDDAALVEGKRYAWFWRCEALLSKVQRVIIATDDDEPGRALAADLCRLFGPERCMFVTYPAGMKDANDVLLGSGADTLVRMLDSAKPYPIKGLFRLSDFPDFGELPTMPLGIAGLGEMLPVVPSALTVVTGYPGHGKTSLTMRVVANMIEQGAPVCMGSFETLPKPILQRRLRAQLLRCQESALHNMPRDALASADALIERNLSIVAQMVGEDDEMDLDFFLERARISVLRDGARMILLDPWNEVEHKRRPDESETEYTSRALRAIKQFMREYQVAFWVIAHPAKPGPNVSRKHPPGLLDISGSAHWANKPDYGVVSHRPDKESNRAVIQVTKVRMGYPGREGKVELEYDWHTASYRVPETPAFV